MFCEGCCAVFQAASETQNASEKCFETAVAQYFKQQAVSSRRSESSNYQLGRLYYFRKMFCEGCCAVFQAASEIQTASEKCFETAVAQYFKQQAVSSRRSESRNYQIGHVDN